MREVTLPWPTCAFAQTFFACAEEIELSRASEQVGRPLLSMTPLRLISSTIFSSFGGSDLSVVVILPPIVTVTGASSWRGSRRGEMSPLKVPWSTPLRSTSAVAEAATALAMRIPMPSIRSNRAPIYRLPHQRVSADVLGGGVDALFGH